MNKNYKITREKFFDLQERNAILKTSEKRANADKAKGRVTWPIRYMLVHLALNSGLRVSEIAKLKIEDLKLSIKPSYIFVRNGKRRKSRDVYIDLELTKHLQEFILQKKNWNQSIEPLAPLFFGQGGQHSTTTALYISFKQAVREAGLRDDLTIHSARHSYATLLYYKTKDLRAVQKQLGHSSLNMTTLYADIMPEENEILANAILGN
ncbi:MAG: tyrosine-type recombinase/integrase [Bacteroidales bacterium]|jgi:integrase